MLDAVCSTYVATHCLNRRCTHVFRGRARTLVDGLANRLAVVNVETVGETPAEVKYQALVNKLSARLAEVEIDTNNHTLV